MSSKNNEKIVFSDVKVKVVRKLPHFCSDCNIKMIRGRLRKKNGKVENMALETCPKCGKRFVTIGYYCTNKDKFICENPSDACSLAKERDARIEARKKGVHKIDLVKSEAVKKELLTTILHQWKKVPGFDNKTFSEAWLKIVLRAAIFESLFVGFILEDSENQFHYIFISTIYNDINDIGFHTSIVHVNSSIAVSLLESVRDNNTDIDSNNKHYNVVNYVVLRENILKERVGIIESVPYNSKEVRKASFDYSGDKRVHVYFRLTNACLRNKHTIENVTAKTINAKNGETIEVNVFHCTKCDKYFINYEALQKYISRGIYPALKYYIEKDIDGLNDASQLMLYGYNVRAGNLSTFERRTVLSWIIDSGLLTKAEIINDLQFKVRYNGSKAGNEIARDKWLDDIRYVSQYVKDNTKSIKAIFDLNR